MWIDEQNNTFKLEKLYKEDPVRLKGQLHEIFDPRLFSSINPIPT
jgi:hypothetical protein